MLRRLPRPPGARNHDARARGSARFFALAEETCRTPATGQYSRRERAADRPDLERRRPPVAPGRAGRPRPRPRRRRRLPAGGHPQCAAALDAAPAGRGLRRRGQRRGARRAAREPPRRARRQPPPDHLRGHRRRPCRGPSGCWPPTSQPPGWPQPLRVITLHAPLSQREDQVKIRTLEAVHASLAALDDRVPALFCGDLNTPQYEARDGVVQTFAQTRSGRLRPGRGERHDRAERSIISRTARLARRVSHAARLRGARPLVEDRPPPRLPARPHPHLAGADRDRLRLRPQPARGGALRPLRDVGHRGAGWRSSDAQLSARSPTSACRARGSSRRTCTSRACRASRRSCRRSSWAIPTAPVRSAA